MASAWARAILASTLEEPRSAVKRRLAPTRGRADAVPTMTDAPSRPQNLVGEYRAFDRVLSDDEDLVDDGAVFEGYELEIPTARRVELDDGRIAFVFEGLEEDDGSVWEGRLDQLRAGSQGFAGWMRTPGEPEHPLRAELWQSPEGDAWLLLGSYIDPHDGDEIDISFTFEIEEDE